MQITCSVACDGRGVSTASAEGVGIGMSQYVCGRQKKKTPSAMQLSNCDTVVAQRVQHSRSAPLLTPPVGERHCRYSQKRGSRSGPPLLGCQHHLGVVCEKSADAEFCCALGVFVYPHLFARNPPMAISGRVEEHNISSKRESVCTLCFTGGMMR